MKQCFSWWSSAAHGVEDQALMEGARRIGYAGVELLKQELFNRAIDCGFEIVSHNGHGTIESGLNDPANHERIEREIEANLALASRYGIRSLIVFSGSRRPGLSEEAGLTNTISSLKRLAPMAEQAGVNLILELLNSKVDHPGYQCDHAYWGFRAVEAVGSPRVKLLYDIYHAQIMEGDLIRTIRSQSKHIAHYHTAGNPGRHDLDDQQEIGYPAVFRAIAETGYTGYVGHEFDPRADPLLALQHAFRLVESSLEG